MPSRPAPPPNGQSISFGGEGLFFHLPNVLLLLQQLETVVIAKSRHAGAMLERFELRIEIIIPQTFENTTPVAMQWIAFQCLFRIGNLFWVGNHIRDKLRFLRLLHSRQKIGHAVPRSVPRRPNPSF